MVQSRVPLLLPCKLPWSISCFMLLYEYLLEISPHGSLTLLEITQIPLGNYSSALLKQQIQGKNLAGSNQNWVT